MDYDKFSAQVAANVLTELFKKSFTAFPATWEWLKNKGKENDWLGIQTNRYAEHIQERWGKMKVLGMRDQISLQDITVSANILEKIPAREWKEINNLDKQFDFSKREFGTVIKTLPALQVLEKKRKIMVLGKPGAGKTTFLKTILFHSLKQNSKIKAVPIYIGLKEFSDTKNSLWDYLIRQFNIAQLDDCDRFVESLLKYGGCTLLLDGLDEVKQEEQDRVVREVKELMDKYPSNRFILTCRTAVYHGYFYQCDDIEIADFNPEQIRKFIENWFRNEYQTGENMLTELANHQPLKELAKTPILLTLLCLIYQSDNKIPTNRAGVYQRALEVLLNDWDAERRIRRTEIYANELNPNRKKQLLREIAMQTFVAGQYYIKEERLTEIIGKYIANLPSLREKKTEEMDIYSKEVLKEIEANHGVLVTRANCIYSFSHLSFQEYLTAEYFKNNKELCKKYFFGYYSFMEEQYREVSLLLSQSFDDATSFIQEMKKQIDQYAIETGIAELLQKIYTSIKPDSPYHAAVNRAIAVYYTLARDRVLAIARAFNRAPVLDLALDLDRALAYVRDISFAYIRKLDLSLARDFALDLDLSLTLDLALDKIRAFEKYLYANKLLVDCIQSDIYIEKNTRSKILEEILEVK